MIDPRPLPPPREPAVDLLRGLVMLAMLFVNDVAAVEAVPQWLKHFKPDLANGITLVDVVFPAFLFVVGLSVPLAFQARRAAGHATPRLAAHVLLRTASLLLLGVVMVNFRGWGWWPVLALLASVAAFLHVRALPAWGNLALRAAGLATLAVLLLTYPRFHPGHALSPQWWGILGLIGWAYLVAALGYLAVGSSRPALVAGVALLLALFLAANHAPFGNPWSSLSLLGFKPSAYLDLGSMLGTHAACALAGVLLGTSLLPSAPERTPPSRARFALFLSLGLALAAAVTYPSFGLNKNIATPAWAALSSALTALLFIPCLYIAPHLPRPALWLLGGLGNAALLAYLLQPLWFRTWSLLDLNYGALAPDLWTGLARGAAASLLIAALAALAHHRGARLKL